MLYRVSFVRRLVLLLSVLLLSACGGGGGSNAPSFSLSTESIDFSAAQNSTTPSSQSVAVSVSGGTVYLDSSSSSPYFSSSFSITGQTTGEITITPTSPTMSPGVYSGTVTVVGCLDSLCQNQVAGSPKTITVSYTIVWSPETTGASCAGSAVNGISSGSLDSDFCGTGMVQFNGIFRTPSDDQAEAIKLDTSGRILVAGMTHNAAGNYDIALWRFNADGSIDTSFGSDFNYNGVRDGFVTYDSGIGASRSDYAKDLVIDASGRIIVAGYTPNGTENSDLILLRYNNNGVIDTSFGTNGVVLQNNAAGGNSADQAHAITVDISGRYLVTGASVNASGDYDLVVWRFLANGDLDTSFGGDYDSNTIKDGFVINNNAAGGNGNDFGSSIKIDTLGKILVAGSSLGTGSPTGYEDKDMVVWRFSSDGQLDTTFGGDYAGDGTKDGFVKFDGPSNPESFDTASDILLDSTGNIIVVGSSYSTATAYDMVIWKFTPSGTIDTDFGTDYTNDSVKEGYTIYGPGSDDYAARSLALDASGRFVVVGNKNNDFATWRFNSAGTLDASYATGGLSIYSASPYGGKAADVVIDSNGRITATGSVYFSSAAAYNMAIWRLLP